jgi:hypothetical protein
MVLGRPVEDVHDPGHRSSPFGYSKICGTSSISGYMFCQRQPIHADVEVSSSFPKQALIPVEVVVFVEIIKN